MKTKEYTIADFKKEFNKLCKSVEKALDTDSEVTLGGNGVNAHEARQTLKAVERLVDKLK